MDDITKWWVPAALAVLLIAGIVGVIMGRSVWRAPQIVLVICLLLASLIFFFLSGRALQTHHNWNDLLANYRKSINDLHKDTPNAADPTQMSIEQLTARRNRLKLDLGKALAERGRAWHLASKIKIVPETGEIVASFENPPLGIEPKMVLFVFDDDTELEKKADHIYLGEYKVTSVEKGQIKLAPTTNLVQQELDRIHKSQGPWVFYEVMPADSHETFADIDANTPSLYRPLLPADVQPEYAKDNNAPGADDPEDRIAMRMKFKQQWAGDAVAPPKDAAAAPANPAEAPPAGQSWSFKPGETGVFDVKMAEKLKKDDIADYETGDAATSKVYVRQLRDYARLFREAYRRRNRLFAEADEIRAEKAQVDGSYAKVQEDIKAAGDMKTGLTADLTKFKSELDAVNAFIQAIQKRQEEVRAMLSETFRSNVKLAAELASIEKKLVEAINRRSPPAEASAGP